MTQEELLKELLAKLPAEIVEKINAKTITEDEAKQYLQPLLEQFKDQFEGFAPLSDEQLEAVNGAGFMDWVCFKLGGHLSDLCFKFLGENESKAKLMEAGRRERVR